MWHTLGAVASGATLGDWLLLAAGVLLVLYIAGTWNYDYFQKRGLPSTKPKAPFVGDTLNFLLGNVSFADVTKNQYEWAKDHGIFGFFMFHVPGLIVTDPEIIKIITVKEFDSFMNHRTVPNEKSDPLFSKNVFNLKDQRWRDMRATLSPAFTTSKIKGMFPLISRCGEQMARNLRQKCAASAEGAEQKPLPTDMKDVFSRMANDVIATVAFGVECDSMRDPENKFYRMGKMLTTLSKFQTFVFLCYFFIPKIVELFGLRVLNEEAAKFFDSLVHETIRERREKGIFRPDMLQLLMQAQEGELKEDKEDAHEAEDVGTRRKLANEDVSAQAVLFFFAGFETVSVAACFAAYFLSRHPREQKRLQAEVDEAMRRTGGQPTYEAVQAMKYLDAVVNETLRFFPPNVATDRICQKDIVLPPTGKLGPTLVSKGMGITIPTIGLHHDPKYWEEPEKFDPDRFSDENKHKITPFTYMPFGTGPRLCIAQRFALIEVKLALVHLLHHFDLLPSAKTKHPIEFVPGANVMVRGGFWCEVAPRGVEA